MHCREIRDANGCVVGFACGSRTRRQPCSTCGYPGDSLCDYPVRRRNGQFGTCDRRMCEGHRNRLKNSTMGLLLESVFGLHTIDFCRPHFELFTKSMRPMWGVLGLTLADAKPTLVLAAPWPAGGWVYVHEEKMHVLASAEKLSDTKEAAEARLRALLEAQHAQ